MDISEKLKRLQDIITNNAPIVIAYSGGVDSTLLAFITRETVGEKKFVCILVDGPEVPRRGLAEAKLIADRYHFPFEIMKGDPLSHDIRRTNPPDRCRYCKLETYQILAHAADKYNCRSIADGANSSDLLEHRPGIMAFSSCGVIHPFIMAEITKSDIRDIARDKGLPFWNKPSSACLYSRIPYGDEISDIKLGMIEKGEDFLHDLGYLQVRIRHHGSIARIEVHPDYFLQIINQRSEIVQHLHEIGFEYITLDLKGYRSGSMDEVLSRIDMGD